MNNYRILLLFVLATAHNIALLEIRWSLQKWDLRSRLSIYIAVATMEMAFFNGSVSHQTKF
jgi:hypothetical protein